jgi:hypothetical protein
MSKTKKSGKVQDVSDDLPHNTITEVIELKDTVEALRKSEE